MDRIEKEIQEYITAQEIDLIDFNPEINIEYKGIAETDAKPIEIDELINHLIIARQLGNNVCIEYHVDHDSYIIQPVNIYRENE